MKAILYTIILAILPLVMQADHNPRSLDGLWNNHNTQKTIKIKSTNRSIKVKGLYNHRNRWVKFRRNHRGVYRDSRGNRLVQKDFNRLEFYNSHNGIIVSFARVRRPRPQTQYHHYNDHRSQRQGGYYRDKKNNRYNTNHQEHRNIQPLNISESRLRDIEGTYRAKDVQSSSYIIVSTRDGIRVKEKGTSNWYRYTTASDNLSLIDKKGNKYIISRDNNIYWISNTDQNTIQLHRISQETF